jgi:hypothetical protein
LWLLILFICVFLNATCCVILKYLYGLCLVSAPSKSVFLHFFVFWTALLGPFCAGLAGGASAALRACIPAPKVRYAQIQAPQRPQGTILPGPFCAEPTCGANAALRAFVPAPKLRYAQIQHTCAPLVFLEFSIFCVFWTALPGPFRAEPACGASATLHAFVPAPKVRYAQIQLPCAPCILHVLRVLDCTSRSILCRSRLRH